MRTSDLGLMFIASEEALVPAPYVALEGAWTFGLGHTRNAGPPDPALMDRGMPKTVEEQEKAIALAIEIFKSDITKFEDRVSRLVTVPIDQNQFDALVSFEFNSGSLATSTLLRVLNQGDYLEATSQFLKWNKTTINGKKVVSQALVRRRHIESKMFRLGLYPESMTVQVWKTSVDGKIDWSRPIDRIDFRSFQELLSAGNKTEPPANLGEPPAPVDRPSGGEYTSGLFALVAAALATLLGYLMFWRKRK